MLSISAYSNNRFSFQDKVILSPTTSRKRKECEEDSCILCGSSDGLLTGKSRSIIN